jgi:hypothetical protein
MTNNETTATLYSGKNAKLMEPTAADTKADIITGFSLKRSTRNPAGIDMTPYAMKKEKTRNPAAVRLTWKLLIISGTIGPRMFVSRDMTKNVSKTR